MREYLLNNGVGIPVLGFGTWKAQDGEEAYQATLAALKAGYRHIDTAAIYKNEESVGRAIKDSGIALFPSIVFPQGFGIRPVDEVEVQIVQSQPLH